MGGKFVFIVGLGVGYVLGAKAGRQRYEQIAAAAGRVWRNPNVQKGVDQVEDFIKDHAPDVASAAQEGAKKVASVARSARSGAKSASSTSTSRSRKPSGSSS